jgi:hypothetical protein
MQKLIKLLSALDWVGSTIFVVVGLKQSNWWLVSGGVLGLGLAYLKPAERIRAALFKRFVHKTDKGVAMTEEHLEDEAFYAQILGATPELIPEEKPMGPSRTFASPAPAYGPTFVGPSKHNQLRPQHFGQFSARSARTAFF